MKALGHAILEHPCGKKPGERHRDNKTDCSCQSRRWLEETDALLPCSNKNRDSKML